MPLLRTSFGLVLLLSVVLAPPAHGQWVEPPGTGWVKVQVAHQDARSKFNRNARLTPFDSENARSIRTAVRMTGAFGLWRGLDVWADIAYYRLAFNDVQANRLQTGVADPRLYLRAGPSLLGFPNLPFAVALRGGVKLPVGQFALDANTISISQGQRDWDLILEVGKSLHPWPVYVVVWGGYRWREENPETETKPGDERLFHVAVGGTAAPFTWKLAVDGLFGRPPVRTDFGLVLENDRRELVQVIPTVGWQVGPGTIEAGARIPVHGRRFPASPTFTLGYFLTWDQSLGN
ncbi:MAG: transporter [Salinibacter sp.]